MTVKRFFPASSVDEIVYLFEMSTSYSLALGFARRGKVSNLYTWIGRKGK
jgi:hypothetical protein